MTNINDSIKEFLIISGMPMTVESVAEGIGQTSFRTQRGLDELEMGGIVEKILPKNANSSNRVYYSITCEKEVAIKKTENDKYVSNEQTSTQNIVNVKDRYTDLEEKVKRIDDNVNSIYVNIISIMSVFVAIFSLITVNANMVFDLSKEDVCNVIWGIILMNIFVVICILVLLFGIRKIIIKPMHDSNI